ncbi:hypothetical protein JZO86_14345 [Enterococcus ureasiticus]|uniref:hypothetical protein n=1 Tax=Enterococcus ureasiticus TaxID=903984 RepID=UPI001A8C854B|nr:hypothetical protein [Enterococcus ureasiticus]MBO0474879.1 hypothetical protein [Enterococcus ureasiticus]
MLTIQFSGNKRFPKKKLSIFNGITVLSFEEQRIQAAESSEVVTITIEGSAIIDDGFVGDIPLGEGAGDELLSYLESQLCDLYPENETVILQFIEELAEEYSRERGEQTDPVLQSAKRPTNKKNSLFVLLVSVGVLVVLIGAGFFFYHLQKSKSELPVDPKTAETTDSESKLKTAIEEESAQQLGEQFPKERVQIVKLLSEAQKFDKLAQYQELFPTNEGAFHLAFYEKKWAEVIKNPSADLTKETQIMLAHAYIQLGRLAEAEILNEQLKSQTLNTEILAAYKEKAILSIQKGNMKDAEEIQKKINDKDLPELIETGKTCQEMIDHYKKEKDVENQTIWLKRLESLGGDLLSNEKNE